MDQKKEVEVKARQAKDTVIVDDGDIFVSARDVSEVKRQLTKYLPRKK